LNDVIYLYWGVGYQLCTLLPTPPRFKEVQPLEITKTPPARGGVFILFANVDNIRKSGFKAVQVFGCCKFNF
jgi:hypothetical protein